MGESHPCELHPRNPPEGEGDGGAIEERQGEHFGKANVFGGMGLREPGSGQEGVGGDEAPAKDRAVVKEYEEAGVTWWIEEIYASRGTLKQIQKRIAAGPPR